MIHHRKPAIGAEHAQAVRHIVQCRIELTGKRRLPLARHKRAHEYPVKIGRELDQGHKEDRAHERHGDVIGSTAQGQGDDGRAEDKDNLELEYPLLPIGPARAARDEPRGDGQRNHVGHGVVSEQQSDCAPQADRGALDHGPDLITHLPLRGFIDGQSRFALQIPLQMERPQTTGHDDQCDTHPDEI
jgi:hypothetical protein